MKISRNKVLLIATILVLSFVVFVGAALAQGPGNDDGQNGWLQQMQEGMGTEAWGEMIQNMTQTHGAEFSDQMLQQMNESGGCHGQDGSEDMGSMMGDSYGDMMGSSFGDMAGGTLGNRTGQSRGSMMGTAF